MCWGMAFSALAACAQTPRPAGSPPPDAAAQGLSKITEARWWPWAKQDGAKQDAAKQDAVRQDAAKPVAPPPAAQAPALAPAPLAPAVIAATAPPPALIPRKPLSLAQPRRKPPRRAAVKLAALQTEENVPAVATPRVVMQPAPAIAAEKLVAYSPRYLLGLDASTTLQLLGEPDLRRREPFAEVWQYTSPECVLFVFLYTAGSGDQLVAHAETEAKQPGAKHDPAACVSAFAARLDG